MVSNNKKPNDLATFSDYWNQPISHFTSILETQPTQVTLGSWLKACTQPDAPETSGYRKICDEIKLAEHKELEKKLKKSLPAVSVGAVMFTRDKDIPLSAKIANLTGWMQFDVDAKDNPHIKDAAQLRDQLKKIVYVSYCSLSVSGRGVWGLVRIKNLDRYSDHFKQLSIDFASIGIKLDTSKGGNPTDLRIYSYDPQAYIAQEFKVYDRMVIQPTITKFALPIHSKKETWEKAVKLINALREMQFDIAPDYAAYRNIGFAFADEFGEDGRLLFHSACEYSPKYKRGATDKHYSSFLKGHAGKRRVTIATFFYLCLNAGIKC